MPAHGTLKLGTLTRSAELVRASMDKEKRTVRVQFSSEEPVKRWFGTEILDHSPGSMNLGRLQRGAAVLMEHRTDQRCGITEGAEVTAAKTGEAVVRFARTPLGDQCMAEVEDGTLRWLSVGYRVDKFLVSEDDEEYRAMSWEPMEVSFVAIPADPTARVLRSSGEPQNENEVQLMFKRSQVLLDKAGTDTAGGGGAAPAVIVPPPIPDVDRVREIYGVALQFQREFPKVTELADKAIKDNTRLDVFMRSVMDLIRTPSEKREDISAPAIGSGDANRRRGVVSYGEAFVTSAAFKSVAQRGVPTDRRRTVVVEIPDRCSFREIDHAGMFQRAPINAGTEGMGGSTGVNIDFVQGIQQLGLQPLYVADLFAQGTTTGDTVRFVNEATFTQASTRVAEGAAVPEQVVDPAVLSATVEKTAAYLKVTSEMLEDFAFMQSFINQRLAYAVQALEDTQLVSGSGSSQIKGVLNWSGLQTIGAGVAPIDTILRAIEYVRGANNAGFAQPDAVILNPLDWLGIRLTKDANGQYLFGGPGFGPYGVGGYSNVSLMWGVPAVSTTAISQGTALAGAFRMGGQIFRRRGLTIDTTNSDQDDFVKDLITVRATQRMTLAVYQANKFCSVTGIPLAA